MTLNGSDFGSYTSPNTNTHYVALLCTTGGLTIARHSATKATMYGDTMSTPKLDNIIEKTSGAGVKIF